MTSKVTVSVDKDASHTLIATRVARPTGAEYESQSIKAGKEHSFDVGDEEQVVITVGGVTEAPEDDGEAKKKAKA